MKFYFVVQADPGQRTDQEDVPLADPALALFAIADGMGASTSGRPAADLAIHTLQEHFANSGDLAPAIHAANAAVFARTDEADRYWKNPNRPPIENSYELARWLGMGTTIVAIAFDNEQATVMHIGDSRAYRFREEKLEPLTTDHRLLEEARKHGLSEAELGNIPPKVITRAIGFREAIEPDRKVIDVRVGDIFLLSSDGLTDAIGDEELESELRQGALDLDSLASALVTRAKQRESQSSYDNITVILIRIEEITSP